MLHISDHHLFADQQSTLLGVNTYESLCAVVSEIHNLEERPHAVVVSGDISQDLSLESYQHFGKVMQQLAVPILCIPGNHDETSLLDRLRANEHLNIVKDVATEYGNWSLYLLDSQSQGDVHGSISEADLRALDTYASNNTQQTILVFLHHHPVPMKSKWLDAIGLENSREFLALLERHENIKLCGFGHVHQQSQETLTGTLFSSVPSTCVQFAKNAEEFTASNESPGFAVYHCKDGAIEASHHRVESYIPNVNTEENGY